MAGVRRGGESGESAVAETLDESLLWAYIDGGDMPPEGEPQLTQDETELLKRWIDDGAVWPQFAVTDFEPTPLADDLYTAAWEGTCD